MFDTLALLNREESLQRGTSLWTRVVEWLESTSMLPFWQHEDIFARVIKYLYSDTGGKLFHILVC